MIACKAYQMEGYGKYVYCYYLVGRVKYIVFTQN